MWSIEIPDLLPDESTSQHVELAVAGPALGHAFTAACRSETPDCEERLRGTVSAFASRMKADGLRPEKVVVALKTAIATYSDVHTAPTLSSMRRSDDALRRTAVYSRAFRWLLTAYYD